MNSQLTATETLIEDSNPIPADAPRSQATAPIERWLMPVLGVLAVLLLGGAGVYLRDPLASLFEPPPPKGAPKEEYPLTIIGSNLVSVTSGTPLEQRLRVVPVELDNLKYPLLHVTGYVMARLAPGSDPAESRWDFASPEVATAYGDWLNARADVLFLHKQADKTRELVQVQVEFLKNEMARKEIGVNMGAVPTRDLVSAKADYMKADIQGKKDINEAETNLKKAQRNRSLLERQLLQAGVDPEVVSKATDGLVLVVADVPEAKIGLVKLGQACKASFFGVPDAADFEGRVGRLGPSVAKEKRTLRVTFELLNVSGRLLPGMFADIGLGAESRNVLTVPAEAVLHAGHSDYVLKEESPGKYRIVEVKVDEPRQNAPTPGSHGEVSSCVPVLQGLRQGDRVIGAGSILLKPMMVKALMNGDAVPH